MTALLAVGAVLAVGWGIVRLLPWREPGDGLAAFTVGPLATIGWLALLDATGLGWSAATLLPLPLAVVALSVLRRRPRRPPPPGRDALLVAAAVLPHGVLLAMTPAFGWDFRYIWGLKARVLALAGGHSAGWLAWGGNMFAHRTYPPLWSDLIASGVVLGADAGAVAAVWSGVLCLALAAACWQLAAAAPRWARIVAAVAGGWALVIFAPTYSGDAEPLLAVAAALGLAALVRLDRGAGGAGFQLAAACATLTLTKQEGAALAAALVLAAAAVTGVRRAARIALPAIVSGGAWAAFLGSHAMGPHEYALEPGLILRHLGELPSALWHAAPPLALALLILWGVAGSGLGGRELRPVRIALLLWACAVLGAYLTTTAPLPWHISTSLDRVIAVPLPAGLALALTRGGRGAPSGSPSPDSSPAG